jgi:hypothetical protein
MSIAMRAPGERRLARLHVGLATDDELRHFMLIGAVGLIVLNACDLLLTRHLLAAGAHEGNPLMAGIITGPWGVVVKIVIPMLLALRYLTAPLYRRVALGLGFAVVVYCGVVAWNLHVMLSHGV